MPYTGLGELEDVKHCLPSSVRTLWPHEPASTR